MNVNDVDDFMSWKEAMEEARSSLGYSRGEYVSDWNRLVEEAHEIQDYHNNEVEEDMSFIGKENHAHYLKSDRWKKLRFEVLYRDFFKCKDCGESAVDVHHTTYDSLGTEYEMRDCVSLCKKCHKHRHGIQQ